MKLLSSIVPYLLLVSFYSGTLAEFTSEMVISVNDSPYMGVAVPLVSVYDRRKDYIKEKFYSRACQIQRGLKKDLWPWVFFNRFIGYEDDEHLSKDARKIPFRTIVGMDIYNKSGDLEAFYKLWKIALSTARSSDSPGVIVDPEAYNNRQAYDVRYLAKKLDRSKDAIRQRLREIGKNLAEMANNIYPGAVIWFLFTGFENKKSFLFFRNNDYRSCTYIIIGMLEWARKHASGLKIVSGGELGIGYCHESLVTMDKKIKLRKKAFAPLLVKYPNLVLGGTLAPWRKPSDRMGFFAKGICGRSRIGGLNEFVPLFQRLFAAYDYLWIYAAANLKYNPYDKDTAHTFNRALKRTLTHRNAQGPGED